MDSEDNMMQISLLRDEILSLNRDLQQKDQVNLNYTNQIKEMSMEVHLRDSQITHMQDAISCLEKKLNYQHNYDLQFQQMEDRIILL